MERKPHVYSTYKEDDLIGTWHAQAGNLQFWEKKGEAGRVSAEDCRQAMRQIEAELERRFTLPVYMRPKAEVARRLP